MNSNTITKTIECFFIGCAFKSNNSAKDFFYLADKKTSIIKNKEPMMQLTRLLMHVMLMSLVMLLLNGCETTSPAYQSKYYPKKVRYVESENIQHNLATEENQELEDEI
jgi:hypothetical protein